MVWLRFSSGLSAWGGDAPQKAAQEIQEIQEIQERPKGRPANRGQKND